MSEAIPKIEGHATFYAHLKSGRIDKARIIGLNGERFVEKILFGRKYFEAPIITSRICGICPVIHNITSTKAVEDACGIKVSEQTKLLRELMLCGQMIQSHSLHLYLLVLPDFVGLSSSFELQKNHPDLFQNAISLKRYADKIVEIIGGRAVHPVSNVVGGFKKLPDKTQLKNIYENFDQIKEIALTTLKLFLSFDYPDIKREIIYSALSTDVEYAFYQGNIKSTSDTSFKPQNYKNYIYEEIVPYNRAKFATLRGKELVVGAMARFNLNRKKLPKEVINLLSDLDIPDNLDNPFQNIIAQAVENYYFIILSHTIIKELLRDGLKEEKIIEPKKFSDGATACEAPRGTLFHYYKIDKDGIIIKCDIITPTVQNLPSLERDMKLLTPLIKDKNKTERDHLIEMLIRAYDPCLTCATH